MLLQRAAIVAHSCSHDRQANEARWRLSHVDQARMHWVRTVPTSAGVAPTFARDLLGHGHHMLIGRAPAPALGTTGATEGMAGVAFAIPLATLAVRKGCPIADRLALR